MSGVGSRVWMTEREQGKAMTSSSDFSLCITTTASASTETRRDAQERFFIHTNAEMSHSYSANCP